MTGWKKGLAWVLAVVVGLVLIALGGYVAATDLDRADKMASVVGAVVALVGLGLSVYGVVLARGGLWSPTKPGRQTVERVDARSGIDIVDTVAGDVRLGSSSPSPAPGGAMQTTKVLPTALGEQSVADVWSGGHVRIVRGVGGNVDSTS